MKKIITLIITLSSFIGVVFSQKTYSDIEKQIAVGIEYKKYMQDEYGIPHDSISIYDVEEVYIINKRITYGLLSDISDLTPILDDELLSRYQRLKKSIMADTTDIRVYGFRAAVRLDGGIDKDTWVMVHKPGTTDYYFVNGEVSLYELLPDDYKELLLLGEEIRNRLN